MRRIIATLAIVVGATFMATGVAGAHDVTPDNGSQCTSPTTGEVKFNATNMGSEQRDLFVYLNGNLVGSLLDFTGNGSHKVLITVPAGLTGNVTFTWSSDAVMHGSTNIVIDWSKPKCQPEVTTTTSTTIATTTTAATTTSTTIATTTTAPPCTVPDSDGEPCVPDTQGTTTTMATTTTTATTLPTTTTTATTLPTTTTTLNCGLCNNLDSTTTTAPVTTTIATTTTAPAATTTVAPPTSAETAVGEPPTVVVAPPEPEMPVTGSNTVPMTAAGLTLIAGGAISLLAARRKAAA